MKLGNAMMFTAIVVVMKKQLLQQCRAFSSSSPFNSIVSQRIYNNNNKLYSTTTKDEDVLKGRLERQGLSLEPRSMATHLDIFLSHLKARQASDETLDAARTVASLQDERLKLIQERDHQLNLRREASAKVGIILRQQNQKNNDDNAKAKEEEELQKAKEESTQATELADKAEAQLVLLEEKQNNLLAGIPNLLDDCVPTGKDESENQIIYSWGNVDTMPSVKLQWNQQSNDNDKKNWSPQWHDDVAMALGGYQQEAAVKMSGTRFVALSGPIARLERAIGMYLIDRHVQEGGYTEVSVPYIVSSSALVGTSQLPKFKDDLFTIAPPHECNGEEAHLIPTAEVPLTNLHAAQPLLEQSELPKKYVAWTPCFRAEAGSYGRDTKGLIRTHQFQKVELVKITSAETSQEEHEALTRDAEACLQALELPYRKVRLCSGDLGFAASQCYDLEVWLPGAREYREISSCSNTRDFQARRMGLRYRPEPPNDDEDVKENNGDKKKGNKKKKKKKKPKPVLCHTINGSGLAVGRTLVAILENYQRPDGSVVVPRVLQPYMGGMQVIEPPSQS